jgi:hypothetical protein
MIFISHTHSDKAFVDKLVHDLSSWKFELWYSTWEIKVGESVAEKVQSALKESDCLIVVLSKNSCNAGWVKTEVNSYLNREISHGMGRILPVRIEECDPGFFINDKLQIRFDEKSYDDAFLDLVFELLEFNDTTKIDSIVNVFRKAKSSVRSLKQYILRRNDIVNNPLHIKSDYVIVNDKRLLKILENRDVFCKITLDILLCKYKWNFEDWSDSLYDNREKPTIDDVGYQTNSNIISSEFNEEISSLVIKWSPITEMRPGRIYQHSYEFVVKEGFIDPTNYWVHRRYPYPTLWSEVEIQCESEIDAIKVSRPPYTFELIEPWEFIAYATRSYDDFETLKSKSHNNICIELNSLEIAEGLLIAFLFPNWKKYHLDERKDCTTSRDREFEQCWLVESEFRKEMGWTGIANAEG